MSTPALVGELDAAGVLTAEWREAVTTVDRRRFLPDLIWTREGDGWVPCSRADDPERWEALAHSDTALVTQMTDAPGAERVPTSSASMPRVVATMLRELAPEETSRVLEIGTGTGYNAALLAHRLGSQRVTTVDIDPDLTRRARTALAAQGLHPSVITADGEGGWPPDAPYDRIIATCAVHQVPYAWVEQAAPGAVIVTPWGTALRNGVLLRLTVRSVSGELVACGPVVDDSAFMWMRAQAPAHRDVMATVHAHSGGEMISKTRLDPRDAFGDDDALHAVSVMVACRSTVGYDPQDPEEWTLWLADAATGSWASVDVAPGADANEVTQRGPRRLWAEVEHAYQWWSAAGRPARTRYGLTVARTGQHVWLDHPDQPVPRAPRSPASAMRGGESQVP
ncbi:methyltransferase domain-containing protein [Streptomyces sp. AC536]|nr:methyltransferase domain-containing protein [Streptomyces buecherae]MBC3981670.1 methyltransferase domain-containing protein [Streptomyces buecherae]QNJ41712.1 methyltransferase domain-containing protein [Streptomyces buecherae]